MRYLKKPIKAVVWIGLLMVAALACLGAATDPEELEGEVVEIQDIIEDPSSFEGKMVVIQGRIERICPAGCWFIIDDKTGNLFVDLFPNDFVLPQNKRASEAVVYGKVSIRDGDPYMIGEIVKIGKEIYR